MPSVKPRDTVNSETFLASYSPEVQDRVSLGWQLIGCRVPEGSRSRYFCFVAPRLTRCGWASSMASCWAIKSQLEGDGNHVRFVSISSLNAIDPRRLSSHGRGSDGRH